MKPRITPNELERAELKGEREVFNKTVIIHMLYKAVHNGVVSRKQIEPYELA